jgi:hypothetical protein
VLRTKGPCHTNFSLIGFPIDKFIIFEKEPASKMKLHSWSLVLNVISVFFSFLNTAAWPFLTS